MQTRRPYPILLGGEQRSGTTLLSVVLDSHHLLDVGPELDFTAPVDLGSSILEACDLLCRRDPRVLGEGTATQDQKYYDAAHFVKQCQRYGIEFEILAELVQAQIAENHREIVSLEDRCMLVEAIGQTKLASSGKWTWGIKLQRKIIDIDVYARIWPEARFVHIVRDGRDVAASHLHTVPDWGYSSIHQTAYQWRNLIEQARLRAPAERYLEINYEELVSNPEPVCKNMCNFLEIPYDEAMTTHERKIHSVHLNTWGHPAAKATAEALSTVAIGRYKQDLSPEQTREFEQAAGPTLLAQPITSKASTNDRATCM